MCKNKLTYGFCETHLVSFASYVLYGCFAKKELFSIRNRYSSLYATTHAPIRKCSVKIRVLNSSFSAKNFQHEVLVPCYRQKIGKANSGRTVINFISTKRENVLLHTAIIEYHWVQLSGFKFLYEIFSAATDTIFITLQTWPVFTINFHALPSHIRKSVAYSRLKTEALPRCIGHKTFSDSYTGGSKTRCVWLKAVAISL